MDKESIISQAYKEFSEFEKPPHSTKFEHCDECAEHDETLQNVKVRDLTVDQIGTVCWGPVPFLLPEAMAYYMPRFIELALLNVENRDKEPYITQFINQIGDNPKREAFRLLKSNHVYLIAKTYDYINLYYRDIIESRCWDENLDNAIKAWNA